MLLLQQDLCTGTDEVPPFKKWLSQGEDTRSMETGLCRLLLSWKNQILQCHLLDCYLSPVQGQESCCWLFKTLPCDQRNDMKTERRNTRERNVWCRCKGMTPASQRCFFHSCALLTSCSYCPDGHVAPCWNKTSRIYLSEWIWADMVHCIHLV